MSKVNTARFTIRFVGTAQAPNYITVQLIRMDATEAHAACTVLQSMERQNAEPA